MFKKKWYLASRVPANLTIPQTIVDQCAHWILVFLFFFSLGRGGVHENKYDFLLYMRLGSGLISYEGKVGLILYGKVSRHSHMIFSQRILSGLGNRSHSNLSLKPTPPRDHSQCCQLSTKQKPWSHSISFLVLERQACLLYCVTFLSAWWTTNYPATYPTSRLSSRSLCIITVTFPYILGHVKISLRPKLPSSFPWFAVYFLNARSTTNWKLSRVNVSQNCTECSLGSLYWTEKLLVSSSSMASLSKVHYMHYLTKTSPFPS